MPRRIEIELTSAQDDTTWTWRAAGAKAPKGTVPSSLLPAAAKVGDVLRVEAEFFLDGIEITSVVPPKAPRQEPERLELIAPAGADEPLVTTKLASRGRDDRRPRREGPRRDSRPREGARREGAGRGGAGREGEHGDGERSGPKREGGRQNRRREGAERPPRRTRPEPPPMPAVERPKAKRLRPGRVHRTALLESLPEDQRRIAEQVVLGGLPAVRQAIDKQNEERTAAGESAISAGPLIDLAEKLVPRVRSAEWRDRAEAALRDLEHVDLRDLRSVVSAADPRAKDPEARELAEKLQAGLLERVEAEHSAWLQELAATLDVGRIVRALRVSSRPPKAGAPLPPEVATRLTTMSGEALTAEAAPERWVAVLDALAFSPVRDKVIPASLPKELHGDVKATIARLATRIPKVAHIFEIEPDPTAPRPKPERRQKPKPKKPKQQAKADKPKKAEDPKVEEPKAEAPEVEDAKVEEPKVEEPKVEEPKAEEPKVEHVQEQTQAAPEPSEAPDSSSAPEAQLSEDVQPGEAAGGAGVSPADAPEGGSATPEAPEREPQASTE